MDERGGYRPMISTGGVDVMLLNVQTMGVVGSWDIKNDGNYTFKLCALLASKCECLIRKKLC